MKIDDRFLLGVLCGVLGNVPKQMFMYMAKRLQYADVDGFEKGAGMFIDPIKIRSKEGKALGVLADTVVAGMLGVVSVYLLSVCGPRNAILKGALAGQGMWQSLYGVLGNMGASRVRSVTPGTAISEFVGHTLYGASTNGLAILLGDPKLFTEKPLICIPIALQIKESSIQPQQNGYRAVASLAAARTSDHQDSLTTNTPTTSL